MHGRSRHGLYAVMEGDAPPAAGVCALVDPGKGTSVGLHLQSVVLGVAGTLNADTAGRLRMVLSMFTVDSGPRELVLDLSEIFAVDEEGMAPIVEADEMMHQRTASLRLASVSPAVDRFLDDGRGDRAVAARLSPGGALPEQESRPGFSALTTTVRPVARTD
jgi:anti-anti-sigma factor